MSGLAAVGRRASVITIMMKNDEDRHGDEMIFIRPRGLIRPVSASRRPQAIG